MTARPSPNGDHSGATPAAPLWRRLADTPLNRRIVLACLAIIICIWLAALQRTSFEREQAVSATMASNANLAIAFEQQVFRTLKSAEQVAAFVREQYLQHGSDLSLQQWIERHIIREDMFSIISIVDDSGKIVRSSEPTGVVNYADRTFFQAQRDGMQDKLFVNWPVFGRVSSRWQIPMSLRITQPDGRFGGVVVLSVDPANFTDFYRYADIGPQGLLELSGFDGMVRARKIDDHDSFGMDAAPLTWFQNRLKAPEGAFVDDGSTTDGVQRIVSYRTMAGYPLMVTVGTAYDNALAPVWQRRSYYLAVVSCATVVLLVFAGLLITVLTRQRDVSQALQSSEALFRATFHQAATGIAHVALDGRILRANEKFCRMLGYSSDELHALTVFDLSEAQDRDSVRQFITHRLSSSSQVFSQEIEKPYQRKDGTILWVSEALGVVKDQHGNPDFLVAITQDITARKELEARLSHDALHDALTGLPNRVMFQDRLSQVMASTRRHGGLSAVLYVDLDGFKMVNDSQGHAVGDALLQQVARRLEHCVRTEDTVSRVGGDEFGIVLATLGKAQDCKVVASNIIRALSTPFDLDSGQVHISASVGAAIFPLHGDDSATLVAHADAAMYAAKNAGKNQFCWEPMAGGQMLPLV